jgi:hypothetical protein
MSPDMKEAVRRLTKSKMTKVESFVITHANPAIAIAPRKWIAFNLFFALITCFLSLVLWNGTFFSQSRVPSRSSGA